MTEDDQQGGDDARAQAAQWFARLKTVPVQRETLEEFFAWKRIDEHAAAFAAVERFWAAAGTAHDQPAVVAATEAALQRGAERDDLLPRPRRGLRLAQAAAAILVVGAGAGAFYFAPHDGSDHYATRVGEQSMVTLADGSKVMLDTDTKLTVDYKPTARRVRLGQGQAYFTVAHEAARPFTVEAGPAGVVATGTQFEVRRDGGAVDVTLVEGRVQVSEPGAATRPLAAGQQWLVRPNKPSVLRVVDTGAATAWKQGRIILEGRTLADAIAEVNRYTTRAVRLDATGLADRKLSGTLDVGDIDSFVAAVTALLPLAAQHQPDGSIRLVDRDTAGVNLPPPG